MPIGRVPPWYFAYLILGLLTSGMLPFLLPLMVAEISHQRSTVAYVTGAYDLGLLVAPVFGKLAEQRDLYRPVFFGGFILLGLAFAAFPLATALLPWFLLAILIGVGTGAAGTVATLFIVNFAPKSDWERQIGWLQSFNGAGQLAGLLLGGAFAHGDCALGFVVGGSLAIPAVLLGGIGLPTDGIRRTGADPLRHVPIQALLHATQLGPGLAGLLRHSHHLQWAAIRGLSRGLWGPFGRFLLAWAAYNLGVAAFFAYYPLIMRQSYGVAPTVTAFTYALAAGAGIFLFLAASRAAIRYGCRSVFQVGLGLRLAGFLLLALPFCTAVPGIGAVALPGFLLAMIAWPVLSVAGTALTARLTPIGEGAAIGLLNASGALATVIGTFASGPLVHAWGYAIVPVLAVGGLVAAELLMLLDAKSAAPAETARPEAVMSSAEAP